MDKKQYLLKILEQLEPIRDLAKGLKILVVGGYINDEHVLDMVIDVCSNDFELINVPILFLVVEEKFRMPTMSKSPIKTKGSVCGELIVDFLCKHGNMAKHFYLREIN